MYGTIRVIIGLLVLGSYVLIMRKACCVRRRLMYAVGVLTSVALMTALYFVPFENSFLTFRSPEAAYQYVTFGKTNIVHKIDGKESAFVIDRSMNTDTYQIVPKGENGWKIGLGSDTNCIYRNFINGISIDIYRYKSTDEYYLFVDAVSADHVEVKDSRNSEFDALESGGGHFVTYCTYLLKPDEQYRLSINDVQIMPLSQEAQVDAVIAGPEQ